MFRNYFNQSNGILFSKVPIWQFSLGFPYSWFFKKYPSVFNQNDSIIVYNRHHTRHHRPFTGEELRLTFYTPVVLGLKGLGFWTRDFIYQEGSENNSLGLICKLGVDTVQARSLTQDEAIYSTLLGCDYLRRSNTFGGHPFWDTALRNVNSLDSAFNFAVWGIDTNHIYVGTMSTRAEISKIYKWIDAVGNTLVNLKLQAAYYRGANNYYVQDPKINSHLFSKYFVEYNFNKRYNNSKVR